MAFKWSEILIYLLPFVTLFLVGTYGKSYLYINKRIKFAPIDVVFPILLVCLHYVSIYLLYYSLIPHLVVLISVIAIVVLVRKFIKNERVHVGKLARMLVNIIFVISFVTYILVIIARIIQIVR